jgi:hypothetical protein
VAGYRNENVTDIIEALREGRAGAQVRGKAYAGQIPLVLTVCGHDLKKIKLHDATKPNITTSTRKLQCQRSSPGTGADHCNCSWC